MFQSVPSEEDANPNYFQHTQLLCYLFCGIFNDLYAIARTQLICLVSVSVFHRADNLFCTIWC